MMLQIRAALFCRRGEEIRGGDSKGSFLVALNRGYK
jgi:hypothetical protein